MRQAEASCQRKGDVLAGSIPQRSSTPNSAKRRSPYQFFVYAPGVFLVGSGTGYWQDKTIHAERGLSGGGGNGCTTDAW
jgi:hypothetical protein